MSMLYQISENYAGGGGGSALNSCDSAAREP